jgi:ubiquinone/menaquinone biosynthesis C-methylase UbiE
MAEPWLNVPADEYEAHMRAAGQTAALREIFGRVYADVRPARLAVLGCTTGGDLALVDPARTELAVGVDINPAYLEIARGRLRALGPRLQLVCADAVQAALPDARYDLIHLALLLEYVDPMAVLERVHGWLGPAGTCSLVTQEPSATQPAVGETPHASLRALAPHMTLRTAEEIEALASRAGFALAQRRTVRLPTGKALVSALFDKARRSMNRPPRRGRC